MLSDLIREWSGWSGRNLTWNFARLQSPSSHDCTQNFSYFCAAQECERIAQSWNVQFKFAQPRTRITAVCLPVALYSPVHSNWLLGPGPGKAIKKYLSSWELYKCCALVVEEVISWHLWFSSDYQILHCNVERCRRFANWVSDKILSDRTIQFQLFHTQNAIIHSLSVFIP
jgi:hypothetical protein